MVGTKRTTKTKRTTETTTQRTTKRTTAKRTGRRRIRAANCKYAGLRFVAVSRKDADVHQPGRGNKWGRPHGSRVHRNLCTAEHAALQWCSSGLDAARRRKGANRTRVARLEAHPEMEGPFDAHFAFFISTKRGFQGRGCFLLVHGCKGLFCVEHARSRRARRSLLRSILALPHEGAS